MLPKLLAKGAPGSLKKVLPIKDVVVSGLVWFGFILVVLAVVLKRRAALQLKKTVASSRIALGSPISAKFMADTFTKFVRFRTAGQTSSHSCSTFPGTEVCGTGCSSAERNCQCP